MLRAPRPPHGIMRSGEFSEQCIYAVFAKKLHIFKPST